jgi:hypothetical protein
MLHERRRYLSFTILILKQLKVYNYKAAIAIVRIYRYQEPRTGTKTTTTKSRVSQKQTCPFSYLWNFNKYLVNENQRTAYLRDSFAFKAQS